jgi:hypothetical protein
MSYPTKTSEILGEAKLRPISEVSTSDSVHSRLARAVLPLCLVAALLLAGCELFPGSPTAPPAPTPAAPATSSPLPATSLPAAPTIAPATSSPLPATSLPAAPTIAPATSSPLPPTPLPATPTPRVADRAIRLGALPWNSYDPQAAALDRERGLAYILALSGEAAPQGQGAPLGTVTVVDLAAGAIRASAPLANLRPACAAALSADGARLYIVTGSGQSASLLVISTGVSGKLGDLLAARPGILSIALEPQSNRLFALDATHLRRLNAQTLVEEAAAPFAGIPPLPAQIQMTVNRADGRVYIIRPDHQAVAVYRADNLQPEPDLRPGGDLTALLADPLRPQTYALCQHFTTGDTQSSVALLRDGRVAAVWRTELGYQTGQMLMDEASSQLLLLEDAWSMQNRHSRLRALQLESGQQLSIARAPYLDFIYARSRFLHRGQLYRLADDLVSIRLADGQLGQTIPLGIALVSAALNESGDRLAALDSSGMLHLLDAAALTLLRSYPALDFRQDRIEAAALAYLGGRLYITDSASTLVYEAETGRRLAVIAKSGQVIQDTRRQRLYLISQGVYQLNASFQLSAAIPETIPPSSGAPGAVAALYDAARDRLLVKMSNNAPGSDRADYLLLYEAETLRRAPVDLKIGQRFVTGTAMLSNGQMWIAGDFPRPGLSVLDEQGRLLKEFPGLGGTLFASPTAERLYLADRNELVTVDAVSLAVSNRRDLPEGAVICAADLARGRLYAAQSRAPRLLIIEQSP